MDTYSHLVLRSAGHLGIPSAMLVSHWDYFSKKGMLRVSPDSIYVWGEDMRRSAIEHNGLDPGTIAVVGAPQFEKYLQPLEARREAARNPPRHPAVDAPRLLSRHERTLRRALGHRAAG